MVGENVRAKEKLAVQIKGTQGKIMKNLESKRQSLHEDGRAIFGNFRGTLDADKAKNRQLWNSCVGVRQLGNRNSRHASATSQR